MTVAGRLQSQHETVPASGAVVKAVHAGKIVLLSTAGAVLYGILHDLVTAHVCVEYFSVFHPRIIDSRNPVALALLWGVIATWWVGLPLGILSALAVTAGRRPVLPVRAFLRSFSRFLAVLYVLTLSAGLCGALVHGMIPDRVLILYGLPADKISGYRFCAWAHETSYVGGFLGGGLLLPLRLYRQRNPETPPARSGAGA